MRFQPKKPVVFLDFHNTLIFEGFTPFLDGFEGFRPNDNLIHALLRYEIKDLYLMDAFRFKAEEINQLISLVAYLKEKGFRVHGVISPADMIFSKKNDLIEAFFKKIYAFEKTEKVDEKIFTLLGQEEFSVLSSPLNAVPGSVFADICKNKNEYLESANEKKLMRVFNQLAWFMTRYLNEKEVSAYADKIKQSIKSYLYAMWVNQKPVEMGDVIVVDDVEKNITAVQGMHDKLGRSNNLFALHNQSENKAMGSQAFYEEKIHAFIQASFSLFNAYREYEFLRQLTSSTMKNKALGSFAYALEACNNSQEVMREEKKFKEKNYAKLNEHRFSFWSKKKTRSALIFEKMVDARKDQLQFKKQRKR